MLGNCLFGRIFRILAKYIQESSAAAEDQGGKYENKACKPFRGVGVLQCVHLGYLLRRLKGSPTAPEQINIILSERKIIVTQRSIFYTSFLSSICSIST